MTGMSEQPVPFDHDEPGFVRWLDENPGCYVLNGELIHNATCQCLRSVGKPMTERYPKFCARTRAALEQKCRDYQGKEARICQCPLRAASSR